MSREGFPQKESEFDKIRKNKEAEGWHFMGLEGLTQTRLSEEIKFEAVPYQTEEAIQDKYLKIAKQHNPSSDFEVELMLNEDTDKLRRIRKIATEEEYRNILENLNPGEKQYLIWVRRIEK